MKNTNAHKNLEKMSLISLIINLQDALIAVTTRLIPLVDFDVNKPRFYTEITKNSMSISGFIHQITQNYLERSGGNGSHHLLIAPNGPTQQSLARSPSPLRGEGFSVLS